MNNKNRLKIYLGPRLEGKYFIENDENFFESKNDKKLVKRRWVGH